MLTTAVSAAPPPHVRRIQDRRALVELADELERIDVKHLQEVARDVLRSKGINIHKAANRTQQETAWTRALAAHALDVDGYPWDVL